jgi:tetratricopeptide (TPR) repeat protein
MDYSNREGMTPAGSAEQRRGATIWLALILGVAAALLVFHAWVDWLNADLIRQAGANYTAFMAAAQKAEGMADPFQRCLNYPNLPGTHWTYSTTRAYCDLHSRKTITLAQIDALLTAGSADQVDRTFQSYHDAEQQGLLPPGSFDLAFYNAGFDTADANTRKIIDRWKQQAPDSAFALAASGMQYVAAEQQARSYAVWRDLTQGQIDAAHQQALLARQDLDRAVTLQSAITVAYTSMMAVGLLDNDQGYLRQAADAGLKIDPANAGIRGEMMNAAHPKWGSAFGGEHKQKHDDESLFTRNPLLRMVASEPAVDRATCQCHGSLAETLNALLPAAVSNVSYKGLDGLAQVAYNHNPRLAVEFYSESLRFNPINADALKWRAFQMIRLGDPEGAIHSIEPIAQRFPDNDAVATELGNIYAQTGHVEEAESTFLTVLQHNPDAQKAMADLGDLYNHAGHQPEKAEALADTLISRHPDNPDGYILRACNQMDHNLPGRYDTIHYFIDHFGDRPEFQSQVAEMRAYLVSHPEKVG